MVSLSVYLTQIFAFQFLPGTIVRKCSLRASCPPERRQRGRLQCLLLLLLLSFSLLLLLQILLLLLLSSFCLLLPSPPSRRILLPLFFRLLLSFLFLLLLRFLLLLLLSILSLPLLPFSRSWTPPPPIGTWRTSLPGILLRNFICLSSNSEARYSLSPRFLFNQIINFSLSLSLSLSFRWIIPTIVTVLLILVAAAVLIGIFWARWSPRRRQQSLEGRENFAMEENRDDSESDFVDIDL